MSKIYTEDFNIRAENIAKFVVEFEEKHGTDYGVELTSGEMSTICGVPFPNPHTITGDRYNRLNQVRRRRSTLLREAIMTKHGRYMAWDYSTGVYKIHWPSDIKPTLERKFSTTIASHAKHIDKVFIHTKSSMNKKQLEEINRLVNYVHSIQFPET